MPFSFTPTITAFPPAALFIVISSLFIALPLFLTGMSIPLHIITVARLASFPPVNIFVQQTTGPMQVKKRKAIKNRLLKHYN